VRFHLVRTEVKWWTGSAKFVGQQPPARLLAWPGVRRVQKLDRSMELMRLPELFEGESSVAALAEPFGAAMAAFFRASPLTDLALAARAQPPFAWTPVMAQLVASRTGARIARRAISLGDDGGRPALEVIASAAGGMPPTLAPDGERPREQT
jgi:hypothetical protein